MDFFLATDNKCPGVTGADVLLSIVPQHVASGPLKGPRPRQLVGFCGKLKVSVSPCCESCEVEETEGGCPGCLGIYILVH